MSHFDEKSGIITSKTQWGEWWQTLEEIYVLVSGYESTLTKHHIQCVLKNRSMKLVVKDLVLIEVLNDTFVISYNTAFRIVCAINKLQDKQDSTYNIYL